MDRIDFYKLDALLNDRQREVRDKVRAYVETRVKPFINPYWEKGEFPYEIAMGLKELPIVGGSIQGYGCAGLDLLSVGLVAYELARGDGSIGTFFGVQSGLAMGSIATLGSEEQRQRWLPAMARFEKIGAFGLTEPLRGSDAAHVLTTARREGKHYVLNGEKRWIGNASISDLLIIWAQDGAGGLGGFVVENPREVEGLEVDDICGKITKRAVLNGHITLKEVVVPAENRLAECYSFRDLAQVLTHTRYGVAWEAVGLAAGCYEIALEYALEREQFGRPIAGFQLIQQKLVEMASELIQMQLLSLHLAQLFTAGEMTAGIVAMAKYNNARKARRIAELARETMGGNGVLIENHVARLFTDAEAVYTYEGSNEINLLIAGRELTGISAFV